MADMRTALVRRIASRIRGGTLTVEESNGSWTVGSGLPNVHVIMHDKRTYGALLRKSSIGLAESYTAGWWDTDDLTGLVQILIASLVRPWEQLDRVGRAVGGQLRLVHRSRVPSKETDRSNVRNHYDLPVELYEAMLDESMMYSCGVFEPPGISLSEAQRIKNDRICTKLNLGPNDHLLEIGTGWGGFALHAAGNYGCRVTTTTISKSQFDMASKRVAEAGLSDRIDILDSDYRDLQGSYDKLVSIEMIEAVGWRQFDAFFTSCEKLLKPEGLMVLQAIVIADQSYERAKHHDDFIRRMIFPGGCIPSITAITDSLTQSTNLRIFDLDDIGQHYATTLRCWHDNLERRWEEVVAAGLDEEFHRLWRLYLCYCEAAFLERHTSDVQMVIAGRRFRPSRISSEASGDIRTTS